MSGRTRIAWCLCGLGGCSLLNAFDELPAEDARTGPKPLGAACGEAGECTSGFCVDAVCCETACEAVCSACVGKKTGVVDGTCALVPAGTDPDQECGPDVAICAAARTCAGTSAACSIAPLEAGVECRPAAGGCDLAEHCDGVEEMCGVDALVAAGHFGGECGPYLCDGQSAACPEGCQDDGDCIGTYHCDAQGKCRPWRAIVGGGSHTCVRLAGGNVRCWGLNDAGQLGLGHVQSIGDDEPAAKAGDVDVGGAVVQLVAGDNHTCALLETGNVRCWGLGEYGALGYGNNEDVGNDEVPSSAGDVDVGGKVRMLAAGFAHTCALLETGHVRCWGCADFGQLGYGNTNMVGDDETPASAGDVDVGGEVVQVVAGGDETCALLTGGRVRCWGWNQEGELGYGNVAQIGDDETPASAGDVDVGGVVVQLDAGFSHTCALLATGNVRCWGWNQDGQLGYGNKNTIGDDESPASAGDVEVGGAVVRLTAGGVHTCALLEGGKVRCWGWADLGQLGLASTDSIGDDEMPASAGHVPVGGNVVQVAAGGNHTCALLETGTLRCWGAGESGQLGYGNKNTIGDDETPASVGDVPFE